MTKVTRLKSLSTHAIASNDKPEIEKGFAIPPTMRGSYWDFMLNMVQSDSFYLKSSQYDVNKAVQACKARAKLLDIELRIQKDDGGARVWRIN